VALHHTIELIAIFVVPRLLPV